MVVSDVIIHLGGKYDLRKLGILGYRRVHYRGEHYHYRFDGKLHRYTFIPVTERCVKVTIRARTKQIQLLHEITFSQINDWVGKSVSTIQLDDNLRTHYQ